MTTSEVREQQRGAWNKFSGGWKKHDAMVGAWLQPVGECLLDMVGLKDNYRVLDAATGTGEPGLTAARRVKKGTVIGSDIAADMVHIAEEKAREAGIKNYEGRVADETALPFPSDHFDAVVCRFGVMYFPDPQAAVQELVRVLKPGRALALSAWAEPQKNNWGTTAARVVNQTLDIPAPLPGAPGIFRQAPPGTLGGMLKQAGLRDVKEVEVSGKLTFETPERYWEFITDVVAPVASALFRVDQPTRDKVARAVLDTVRKEIGTGPVTFNWSSWVAAGTK